MRIGFEAKRLFNNFTGLGNYSRFLVGALASRYPEHEYWLYTPKVGDHRDAEPFLNKNRFTVREPNAGLQRSLSFYWRSVSLGRVAKEDGVTILHGLSNELPAIKPSALKEVVTIHDVIFKRFPGYYNSLDVKIYDWKVRRSLRNADRVVAVSHQTANDLKEFFGLEDEKLLVIYQGCHHAFQLAHPPEAVAAIRKKYRLPSTFILCVGTLEERKNAGLIIKAVSMMKESVPLVLAGRPTKYVEELRRLITENKVSDRVTFLHDIPFVDLPLLYKAASVFVYPSVFEGFGIPIVEAIASGVPVVTSNGSCFSEAGGPATVYVNPANPLELAEAITTILSSSELRKSMVQRSSEYIARFEPGVIAGQMMKVYESLDRTS